MMHIPFIKLFYVLPTGQPLFVLNASAELFTLKLDAFLPPSNRGHAWLAPRETRGE